MKQGKIKNRATSSIGAIWSALTSGKDDAGQMAKVGSTLAVETRAGAQPQINQTGFEVGDLVGFGNLQIVVNAVSHAQTPADEFSKPADGNHWVSLDVSIENIGTKSEQFSSFMSMELQDADASTYGSELTTVEPQAPEGSIEPGDAKRGLVVFEVPDSAKDLSLSFRSL